MSQNNFKSLVIQWNNTFPLDKWFRKKYNLAFNSEAHRLSNPIDIFFEWKEESLFEDYEENEIKEKAMTEEYNKGNWLKSRIQTEEAAEMAFDALNIGAINQSIEQNGSESESE